MLVDASKETQLLVDCRQMVDGPERHDGEIESAVKLEVGHVSFDESDSMARGLGNASTLARHRASICLDLSSPVTAHPA